MQIWALLKGLDGDATFHGIAVANEAAEAWKAGASNNWHYEMETDDGGIFLSDPISYEKAEAGELK